MYSMNCVGVDYFKKVDVLCTLLCKLYIFFSCYEFISIPSEVRTLSSDTKKKKENNIL